MVAGPSEIVVVCDGGTEPDWVAMDLFSQAEHDELAQAILIAPDAAFLEAVAASMERQLPACRGANVIAASLATRGALIRVRDLREACELVNRIAPEHLELSVEDPDALLPKIRHAGAIFLGRYSVGSARRLLRRAQPRAADLAHGALFLAARRLRFPEALERDPRLARRRPRSSAPWPRSSRAAKGCRAHAQSRRVPHEKDFERRER